MEALPSSSMTQSWLMESLEHLWELHGQEFCRLLSHSQDKASPDTPRGSGLGSRGTLVQMVCAPELEQRTLLLRHSEKTQ